MYPVLAEIPLPPWTVPLFPALMVLGGVASLVGLFGWRARAWDLLWVGLLGALGSVLLAVRHRGEDFTLTSIPVYSYGVMLCLALVAGWYLTLHLAGRDGLSKEVIATTYFVSTLSGLLGARLLYVATNPGEFVSLMDALAPSRGGLAVYGGFLGGFIGSVVFLRRRGVAWAAWADVAAPSLAIGLILGRLGCYLFGCDYGQPLGDGAPRWLQRLGTFPRWPEELVPGGIGSPAWIDHVEHRGLPFDAPASLPVHPSQLYEALLGAALLAVVLLARRSRHFVGQVFLTLVLAYGAGRFLLELLRDDPERGHFGPHLPLPALTAFALLCFAGAFCVGPARSIASRARRRLAQSLSLLVAPISYALFALGGAGWGQLSTSQWLGLLTAAAAAAAWQRWSQAGTVPELEPSPAPR